MMGAVHERVTSIFGAIEDVFNDVSEVNREMATLLVRLRAEYAVFKSDLTDAQRTSLERIMMGMEFCVAESAVADGRHDWRGLRPEYAGICQFAAEVDRALICKDEHQINDPTVRAQVWGLTGGKCAYCQTELAPDGQGNGELHTYCVEHVVPVSYGGPNNIRNYVPSCRSCNNSKGDKHVLTFIRNNLPARLSHIGIRLVANGGEAAE